MSTETYFSDLSKPRQRLVRLIQSIHFGRIERLAVRGGEPIFDASTGVVRTLKAGGQNVPRSQIEVADFALKREVIALIQHLRRLGNGAIDRIEVAHGLPMVVDVREQLSA